MKAATADCKANLVCGDKVCWPKTSVVAAADGSISRWLITINKRNKCFKTPLHTASNQRSLLRLGIAAKQGIFEKSIRACSPLHLSHLRRNHFALYALCMNTVFRIITIFGILAVGQLAPSFADQHDPRLNRLFADLQTPLSAAVASETEQKIWTYWTAFPDDRETEATMVVGIRMLEAGRLKNAETVFSRVIKRQPNFAEAWNKRATVRFMIGDHAGSTQDIIKVLQLEPRHFGALSGLGLIQMHAGNLQNALQSYEAAFALHPYLANVEAMINDLKTRLKGQAL